MLCEGRCNKFNRGVHCSAHLTNALTHKHDGHMDGRPIKFLQLNILEGTVLYGGLLLAPAVGFVQDLFSLLKKKCQVQKIFVLGVSINLQLLSDDQSEPAHAHPFSVSHTTPFMLLKGGALDQYGCDQWAQALYCTFLNCTLHTECAVQCL